MAHQEVIETRAERTKRKYKTIKSLIDRDRKLNWADFW